MTRETKVYVNLKSGMFSILSSLIEGLSNISPYNISQNNNSPYNISPYNNLPIYKFFNYILPENPGIKNQKSAITVILTMSEVLHASSTQRGKPSLVDIKTVSYT